MKHLFETLAAVALGAVLHHLLTRQEEPESQAPTVSGVPIYPYDGWTTGGDTITIKWTCPTCGNPGDECHCPQTICYPTSGDSPGSTLYVDNDGNTYPQAFSN